MYYRPVSTPPRCRSEPRPSGSGGTNRSRTVAARRWHASRIVLAAIVALALGNPSRNNEPAPTAHEQRRQGDGFTATLAVDRLALTLADELRLTLTIVGTAPLQVEPSENVTTSPGWEVRSSPPVVTKLSANEERWQQVFTLEPQKPDIALQLAPLRIRGQMVKWGPVPVTVTTTVSNPDLSELADITAIEQLPPPFPWLFWTLTVAGSLLMLAGLVVGGWRWLRRPDRPPPPLLPHQWARAELDRLQGEIGPDPEGNRLYLEQLADVLRRYLELRFEVPALEQTTADILTTLGRAPLLSPPQQEQLRELLERCDLAKFARAPFDEAACRELDRLARELIEMS